MKRRSVMALMEHAELDQAEAQALVGVMDVSEMIGTVARVAQTKARGSLATGNKAAKAPAAGGMHAAEADALVMALTTEELSRTINRAGLATDDIAKDAQGYEDKLRTRASIAL